MCGVPTETLNQKCQVWEGGSFTWSALALELGVPTLSALVPALTVSQKYLYVLKDPWDWKDITAGPGTSG